jgi:hypothetical protein
MPYDIENTRFAEVDLDDPFFDSLKQDYSDFEGWFRRKSDQPAYVLRDDEGTQAFLYLKIEDEAVEDVDPSLPPRRHLKIGTFKINAHGTRLGERFMKRAFDYALSKDAHDIYVTVIPKHEPLVELFQKYGFEKAGTKTTENGTEDVYLRSLDSTVGGVVQDYPLIHHRNRDKYILSIYPDWHTQLLPDSILNNETIDLLDDASYTNSIHKAYICSMEGVSELERGDLLLIYRTTDRERRAYYRSVVTSTCVVEEYRSRNDFENVGHFIDYCEKYSIFDADDLKGWWHRWNPLHVIRFTYNVPLQRRLNRKRLLEDVGLPEDVYWGFFQISNEAFHRIIELGDVDKSYLVD